VKTFRSAEIRGAIALASIWSAVLSSAACSGGQEPVFVTARDLGARLDTSELTPRESKRLETILNGEVSPCGDDTSLGLSLFDPAGCPLAPMAGRFVVELIMEDYNVEEVGAAYMERYAAVKGLGIEIGGAPRRGAEDPTVMIVVFTDFDCPFCAKAAGKLRDLTLAYPEHVAVAFKHFPLKSHPSSELASRAAFAAGLQDGFWQMHDTLFSAQGTGLDRDRIDTMAIGLGLDIEKLTEDISSPAATAALAADRAQGEELGVDGTPTLFVNGRKLPAGIRGLEDRLREEFLRRAILESRGRD